MFRFTVKLASSERVNRYFTFIFLLWIFRSVKEISQINAERIMYEIRELHKDPQSYCSHSFFNFFILRRSERDLFAARLQFSIGICGKQKGNCIVARIVRISPSVQWNTDFVYRRSVRIGKSRSLFVPRNASGILMREGDQHWKTSTERLNARRHVEWKLWTSE